MMVNSRQKGCRGERAACRELNRLFKLQTRRAQQYCGVAGDADVIGLEGVHLEVKWVEALNVHKAVAQAEEDRKDDEVAVVLHKKNGKPWLWTHKLDDTEEVVRTMMRAIGIRHADNFPLEGVTGDLDIYVEEVSDE